MDLHLSGKPRIFLVVVDGSPELTTALHYACLRAKNSGGRVALLTVVEPPDGQNWLGLEELMRAERREAAEQVVMGLCSEAQEWSGTMPAVYIREGLLRDELISLIEEDPSISILVLGASIGQDGPGPLVSHLAGKVAGRLRVPVTVVPGGLSDAQLQALT